MSDVKGKILSGVLSKKHPDDAGQDIYADESVVILPMSSEVISTNLVIAVPEGHVGLIWPRSGLSVNFQLETGAGVIDAGYRGEVKVHLYNFGSEPYRIDKGNKIAQLLTVPINLAAYTPVESLDETSRGDDGFGSSGK